MRRRSSAAFQAVRPSSSFFSSSLSRSHCNRTVSTNPQIDVNGVRSSCDTVLTKSDFSWSAWARRVAASRSRSKASARATIADAWRA